MERKNSTLKLPLSLSNSHEWTLVGPMGPNVPEGLLAYSILGVDGGARFSPRMDAWIGDGDSHPDPIECENIYRFSPQKSASDLALALSLLEDKGPYTLHCWGFLGGRRDHELFNLGEVLSFLEEKPRSEVYFYNSKGKIEVAAYGSGTWMLNHQGPFSLASIKKVSFTITGQCEYQVLTSTNLPPLSSLGLSNFGHGSFELTNQGPILVFYPELE